MALIDVGEVLTDPDLIDSFSVVRRTETVGTNGRSGVTSQTFNGVVGVVTAIGPSELDRQADYQVTPRTISVVTKFRLIGEIEGKQPDVVKWRGDSYLVKAVDYYPQFGQGFVQAECTSIDRVDIEPTLPAGTTFVESQYASVI